jgi:hypothetical protein
MLDSLCTIVLFGRPTRGQVPLLGWEMMREFFQVYCGAPELLMLTSRRFQHSAFLKELDDVTMMGAMGCVRVARLLCIWARSVAPCVWRDGAFSFVVFAECDLGLRLETRATCAQPAFLPNAACVVGAATKTLPGVCEIS